MARVNKAAQEPVSANELQAIAPDIANDWRTVARNLGLESCTINIIAANTFGPGMGGITETALQMLIKWKQSKGEQATKGILIDALNESGLAEVADKLGRMIL